MPKHTPHSERINAAAGIMKSHPTLTAAMAMKLAGFSEEDCSNPSIHALVRSRLPGRGKRAYQKTLPALSTPSPPAAKEPITDIVVAAGDEGSKGSPLTNPTFDTPDNGTVLAQQIMPREEITKQLTEEHSLERQLLLKNATTHGKKFTVLGGQPLTTDDLFIGAEYGMREKEKQRLMVTKTKRLRMMALKKKPLKSWRRGRLHLTANGRRRI